MADHQEILEELCARRRIPGAVFGVLDLSRSEGGITVAAAGVANLNTGLAVTRDTLFQAGSIGKSYTATAVMQLVDDGVVSLDAPLREYLRDLEFADAAVSKTLTARQVLTHTAGIDGDRIDNEGLCGRGDDCLARYASALHDLPLIAPSGGLWSYCNSGYIVLGRLIEVVTGLTYEEAVTKRLLEPLGLRATLFFPGDMVMHSLAVSHVRQGDSDPVVSPKWEMSRAGGPAGSTINTTIDDLLAFARMHLSGGLAADGTRILSETSVRAMQQPLVACPEPELLGNHWGLGWFVRTGPGPTVVGHDGNTIGQTACLRLVPERGVAWGLLMNLAGQNWAALDVATTAIDPLVGTVTPGRPTPSGDTVEDAHRYLGTYASVGARLSVTAQGNGLRVVIRPTAAPDDAPPMTGDLLPITDDRFVLRMPELGDDMLVTFIEPDGDREYRYLHFGARLHRRVA